MRAGGGGGATRGVNNWDNRTFERLIATSYISFLGAAGLVRPFLVMELGARTFISIFIISKFGHEICIYV